jgi:diguanylate cyclase (GGDEF)-like protein
MIDLDDFKNVNDTRGHAAGDQLLREAARRLRQCHRPEDSLARMGGDEFLILLPSIQKTHASQRVVDRVIEAFSRAFEIDGQSYHVTASIGVALYPNDGLNATELLANAESAMYRAKDLGRNRTQFFTAEIHDRVQRRLKLEQLLRGATERGEFVLHYQPIYTGNSPHPAAFEALLRWRQADGSLVSPAEFIPVAEETGIIEEIGTWVMATACLDGVRLCSIYPGCPRVCVNVSPRQLREVGFARRTVLALAATGLPATQLEIEITEGIVVDERPEVAANLEELSRLGVRISIDDFGTGYSSLGYLQRYSFSTLKVDRSFVWEIGKNPAAGRLIEAILNMARGLNLETIAEGVETEAQLEFLLEHGCNLFQGFLLGRPISIEQHLHEVTASVAELS